MKTKLTLATFLTALALAASAQNEIDIQKEGLLPGAEKPVPLALTGFSGEAASVLQFDLEVQGFKIANDGSAQYEVAGSAAANVQGRLNDRVNRAAIFSKSYTGATLRAQAHALADDVVAAITHRKGIGQTKIAFKSAGGGVNEIYVADFDGHNARAVTHDNTLATAPSWVGRQTLFYTSYKLGKPEIFSHSLATGERRVVTRNNGNNFSPAVSPDGRRIAFISNKDGWVDLYVANLDGSEARRLTKSPQDESSPGWSPDGRWILFAGKVGERRALYKISPDGGEPVRIPTVGVSSPSEPDWSPDGRWIVFTSQYGGGFTICVVPAAGGAASPLVEGEDPSWSPNSRTVVFARRAGGGRALSVLDVFTKQVKDVPRISGGSSQPSWAR